jgi:hypothetical protein
MSGDVTEDKETSLLHTYPVYRRTKQGQARGMMPLSGNAAFQQNGVATATFKFLLR